MSQCVIGDLTWKSGDEDRVKPSEPGCWTSERAPGVSAASEASKRMFPKTVACVSGCALSYSKDVYTL